VARTPQSVGLAAGKWCGFGLEGEMPGDQRPDDARSLVFDFEPLAAPMEILGAPEVELQVEVDQPQAFVAVRLNDVGPDGASVRVSYGLLDLAHRDGHEARAAVPVVPGERLRLRVRLNDVAHRFAPGHRLRVAVSTTYWPVAWPSPVPVRLGVEAGASFLELPVRPPRPQDALLPAFEPPEAAPPPRSVDVHPGGFQSAVHHDAATGKVVYESRLDDDGSGGPAMTRLEDIDLEVGQVIRERFEIGDDAPLSAQAEVVHRALARRRGWSAEVETRSRLTATNSHYRLQADLVARQDGAAFFERHWDEEIPRAADPGTDSGPGPGPG
jgi:hypothetical protein